MSMVPSSTYEHFIRGAFKLALKDEVLRGKDPAGLAEGDLFTREEYLPQIKAGTSYCMYIYRHFAWEANSEHSVFQNQVNLSRLDAIAGEVFSAENTVTIFRLIEEFQDLIFPVLSLK